MGVLPCELLSVDSDSGLLPLVSSHPQHHRRRPWKCRRPWKLQCGCRRIHRRSLRGHSEIAGCPERLPPWKSRCRISARRPWPRLYQIPWQPIPSTLSYRPCSKLLEHELQKMANCWLDQAILCGEEFRWMVGADPPAGPKTTRQRLRRMLPDSLRMDCSPGIWHGIMRCCF